MKKIISLIIISAISLSILVSCGKNNRNPSSNDVTYIELSEKNILFGDIGESMTLTYEIGPKSIEDKTVRWNSSDESVVTCENGFIKAVGYGTCVVKAYASNGKSASCIVTVNNPNASISLSQTELLFGAPKQEITITAMDETGKDITDDVMWQVSNLNVADCYYGKVTAVGYGICTLTATYAPTSSRAVCVIRVEDPDAPALKMSKDYVHLENALDVDTVSAVSSNPNVTISWMSTNESVATVSDGNIIAVGAGSCAIIANASNGLSASTAVTVGKSPTPPTVPVALTGFMSFELKDLPTVVRCIDKYTGKIVSMSVITSYTASFEDIGESITVSINLNGVKIYDSEGLTENTVSIITTNLYSNEKKDALRIESSNVYAAVGDSFSVELTKFGVAKREGTVREFYITVSEYIERQ